MCEADEHVLSDVHTELKPIIISKKHDKGVIGQTTFHFKWQTHERDNVTIVTVDEDGDYVVARKPALPSEDAGNRTIVIEHRLSTPLQDVGLQVWSGALLLCDFICSRGDRFKDATVIELGGGVGLSSIVMAMVAKVVYCTDVGEEVLKTCQKNIIANRDVYYRDKNGDDRIIVRELDWLQKTLNTDTNDPFHWRHEDVDILQDRVTVVIAADVIYEDDLTDAFFRTLYRIMTTGCLKVLYITIEKRVNFTIADLRATAESYDHFKECLEFLQTLGSEKNIQFIVKQLPTDFTQYFNYTRTKELELWVISAEWIR